MITPVGIESLLELDPPISLITIEYDYLGFTPSEFSDFVLS